MSDEITNDPRKEIFTCTGDECVAFDSLEELEGIGYGAVSRYVREDLCIEVSSSDIRLKHLPLFNCHADSEGNVWVKLPMKVSP